MSSGLSDIYTPTQREWRVILCVKCEVAGSVGGPVVSVCTEGSSSLWACAESTAAAEREHRPVRGEKNQKSAHSDSEAMAKNKAVLFSFWGVAVSSRRDVVFNKLEELHNLPG